MKYVNKTTSCSVYSKYFVLNKRNITFKLKNGLDMFDFQNHFCKLLLKISKRICDMQFLLVFYEIISWYLSNQCSNLFCKRPNKTFLHITNKILCQLKNPNECRVATKQLNINLDIYFLYVIDKIFDNSSFPKISVIQTFQENTAYVRSLTLFDMIYNNL